MTSKLKKFTSNLDVVSILKYICTQIKKQP